MILVRTPLRISFVGGGTDLPSHFEDHGGAVISTTINKYIYITAKSDLSLFNHKYRLVYSQVEQCEIVSQIKHPIIRRAVEKSLYQTLDLDVMSDVPAGTGLGSSSAFTVGILNALCGPMDKHQLANEAVKLEVKELKEPIGYQDQYASAFGGLNYITFDKFNTRVSPILLDEFETNKLQHSLHLVYLGGTRSASLVLANQQHKKNTKELKRLTKIAKETNDLLNQGLIDKLGEAIREGWELKRSMSNHISNVEVDNIISLALQNGATGGKLLGAGGTGFVLLYCPVNQKDKMIRALSPLKLHYVPFQMEKEGSRIFYET